MNHRVYAHYDGPLWVGVAWLGKQAELTRDMEYVTLQVVSGGEACLTLPDGRILCDFGPEHDHDG